MLVVLGKMAKDVLTVLLVLAVVFGSFCFGLWGWSLNVGSGAGAEDAVSLGEMAGALYFAVLGESDSGEFGARVPYIGAALLSVYQILTVVLLLNVLTGLFRSVRPSRPVPSTITATFDNARLVYAYGRTKIVLRYHRKERQVVAPFNLVGLPLAFSRRLSDAAVDLASGLALLPPLLLLATLADLRRLAAARLSASVSGNKEKKRRGGSMLEIRIRSAWREAIDKYRFKHQQQQRRQSAAAAADIDGAGKSVSANACCEKYDESREAPDPIHTGPLHSDGGGGGGGGDAGAPLHIERLEEKLARLEARHEAERRAARAEAARAQAALDAILAALRPGAPGAASASASADAYAAGGGGGDVFARLFRR
eukprot:tig00000786_g4055.t1